MLLNQAELTDVEKEISTLFVGNTAVGVVGVLPFLESNDKPLIFGPIFVFLQCVSKGPISYEVREPAVCRWMEELLKNPLHVCCPSFIEPEMRGFRVSAEISENQSR